MKLRMIRNFIVAVALTVAGCMAASASHAQTDEIQVYNAQIADPGVINLTLHNNYTPDGLKTATFPGGVVPNHSWNGVPEWALGLTPWWEAGLYMPLYTLSDGKFELDGFKLRSLFVVPHAAERTFFYGVNFEFSFNTRHWDQDKYTQEIRPIVGWRAGRWDFIVNPILDNSWKGFSRLDFAPESRIDYNVTKLWQVGVEEYDDFGRLQDFNQNVPRTHQVFGVVDFNGQPINVEFGAGVGLNRYTDGVVLKLILSKDIGTIRGIRRADD
ncbi:MAG TPA: hypothetical protein VH353_02590 [Caulobacteraceae bacterium]|nr:hypothetical protein [Caulobacteraceae bacterium]